MERGARKHPQWKHLATEQQNILRQKALKDGFDEVLLLDSAENITEGSISNVFFIHNDALFTPKDNILPGTFREFIIECALQHNIPLLKTQIKASSIKDMEVFFCNAIRGIISTAPPSPLLRKLIHIANQHILQRIST